VLASVARGIGICCLVGVGISTGIEPAELIGKTGGERVDIALLALSH